MNRCVARTAVIAAIITAAGCGDNAPALGLQDVTVLFPLPAAFGDGTSLPVSTMGSGGELLPEPLFDQIPPFAATPLAQRAYATWTIVAARLDPGANELRLVAQPLQALDQGTSVADDSILLRYRLDGADFAAFASAWVALGTERTHDPRTAFGVHVEIAAQGDGGPIATAMRGLIVQYAGAATLVEVQFIAGGDDVTWQYGALSDPSQTGTFALAQIDNIGTSDASGGTAQAMTVDNSGTLAITPASAQSTTIVAALGSALAIEQTNAMVVISTIQLTLDLDNPDLTHVDAADCASCHVAGRARARALDVNSMIGDVDSYSDDPFDLSLGLPDEINGSVRQIRALGYNVKTPIWNQRVIDDSASAASALTYIAAPASK